MRDMFEISSDYTYAAVEMSGLWVHPGNIYDMEKYFVSKVDLISSFNFHNGHTVEIKKGDKIFITFNSPSNNPRYYAWEYRINVHREGKWCSHHGDTVSKLTYEDGADYTINKVYNMLENFRLQLEGKIVPLDTILDARVFPPLKAGDTLVSFAWDAGLKICDVLSVSKKKVTYKEYALTKKAGYWETPWENEVKETDNNWLCRYYVPFDINIEDIKNGNILYGDIIRQVLDARSELDKSIFSKAHKKVNLEFNKQLS